MDITSDAQAFAQQLFSSDATQRHPLGTRAVTTDGRTYRYVKAGGTALATGKVQQAPAQDTENDQLTPAAAAIGATSITVTIGSSAAAANAFAGGWAVIDTTPGQGFSYPIIGHAAIAGAAAGVFYLGQAIEVALTTDSRVTLVPNPYNGVIVAPTTLTGAVVGVAVYPIVAGEYGWIGTRGSFGTLIAGTPGVGLAVVVPGSAAGAVVIDGAAAATQVVGSMQVTGVDGKYLPVFWNLP